MLYLVRHPAPPLSAFVANLWCFSDAPPHARERIVPSGTLELVVNLHEDEFRIYCSLDTKLPRRFSGAIVSGAYSGFFGIDTREHASVIAVHFKPGGALPFLGVPPGALADEHVDLETLWGRRARELRERLCAAVSVEERFRILEVELVGRLARPFRRHGAVRVALDRLGRAGTSVSEIAAEVGLSHRRLIEVFTTEIGMTPKLFERVRRFQRAWALARRVDSPDWSRLAIECGYFDQSHLIRDFTQFAGFSPSQLLRRAGPRTKDFHVAA